MTLRLIALAGPLRGETVLLTEDVVTIGRRPSNRVHPDDLALSRQHCVVAVRDGTAAVIDLESSNGTFVNGVPIQERVLDHGDQLKFGESVFVFLDRETAETVPQSFEFNEIVHRQTARLRQQDVLYLQSDQMVDAFPPNPRRARDLHVLLRATAALGSIRSFEKLQHTLVDLLFECVPADCAAILISETRGADFTSTYARGRGSDQPVQISQTVVRQVMADRVGSRGRRQRGQVPRGALLPAQGRHREHARAPGSPRRHSAARCLLSRQVQRQVQTARDRPDRRGPILSRPVRLAGKRSRTGERDRAGCGPRLGGPHSRRRFAGEHPGARDGAARSGRNYHQAVQSAKRHIVTAAFAEAAGSHAAAARLLGLHPNNLHRLIRNLNLKDFIEN